MSPLHVTRLYPVAHDVTPPELGVIESGCIVYAVGYARTSLTYGYALITPAALVEDGLTRKYDYNKKKNKNYRMPYYI